MTELQVGKQHGTGTKSLATNFPPVCASISRTIIGDGHPAQGIALHMAAGVKCRLERNAANGRMLDGKFDNSADFMLVYSALDGGDDRDVEPDLS